MLGICICTAVRFGFGVGLAVGEAEGVGEPDDIPLALGESEGEGLEVGSGMGGRVSATPGRSKPICPAIISPTPTTASRMGTASPGVRRRRTAGSLATDGGDALEEALVLARRALRRRPAGILTDLDGTLAPIVDRPEAARPLPQAVDALARLADRLAVVGIVTGRAAADARQMLGDAGGRLLVIGNHGLEWLSPGDESAEVDHSLAGVSQAVVELLDAVPPIDGVVLEPKGLSATVHYRLALDPAAARARVLAALAPAPDRGLEIREGRMSVELRPASAEDKGSAVRRVVGRYGLRGLLVAGDDVTDLDMFHAAAELRGSGITTAIIALQGGREVPETVVETADATLDGPPGMAALLQALAGDPDDGGG
jgi:trehalose 6-phosphate phosphatase